MKRTAIILTVWAVGLAACRPAEPTAADNHPEEPAVTDFSMRQYQWSHRPLLVFAPAADDPALQQQSDVVRQHRSGFEDRDMVLIQVTANERGKAGQQTLTAKDAQYLRDRYDVPVDQFGLRLVGKDGDVKLKSAKPVTAERLFERIDAMPMRQREMQAR